MLITLYPAKKISTAYRNALIFAYSPVNSVYEDENIKLEIYNEQLWVINKTTKTVFIDLSQCFLVNNGSSFPMWEKKQDEKRASKAAVSTSIDEFISIAPSTGAKQNETFICNMSTRIFGKYSSTESPSSDFSEYDKRLLNLIDELLAESKQADPKKKDYLGCASRHLTEDESISNIGASIAYAFSKRAEEWTNVTVSTWVSDVIFAPYYVEIPDGLSKKEKRGFGVKETSPAIIHAKADSPFEFEEDKSPIIVSDWMGNVKKGTFTLTTTKISKKGGAGFWAIMLTGGYAALFAPPSETYYKSVIKFVGSQDDWGKMSYALDIKQTKRSE